MLPKEPIVFSQRENPIPLIAVWIVLPKTEQIFEKKKGRRKEKQHINISLQAAY